MYEIIQNQMKLKSIAYDFFDEFSYSVKKNDWFEKFRRIIQFLVGFWNDNRHRYFEVGKLVT